MPVVLADDYNVTLTDMYVYKRERRINHALFRKEVQGTYAKLVIQK